VGKSNVELTERLQDFRVSDRCVPYCILASQNARGRDPKKTPEYLGRKEREILKDGESEWRADRSAASDRERWKYPGKNSVSSGRIGSTNWRKYLSATSEPVAFCYTNWPTAATREPTASYLLQHWLCQIERIYKEDLI
jgi:hypothetical protein